MGDTCQDCDFMVMNVFYGYNEMYVKLFMALFVSANAGLC